MSFGILLFILFCSFPLLSPQKVGLDDWFKYLNFYLEEISRCAAYPDVRLALAKEVLALFIFSFPSYGADARYR